MRITSLEPAPDGIAADRPVPPTALAGLVVVPRVIGVHPGRGNSSPRVSVTEDLDPAPPRTQFLRQALAEHPVSVGGKLPGIPLHQQHGLSRVRRDDEPFAVHELEVPGKRQEARVIAASQLVPARLPEDRQFAAQVPQLVLLMITPPLVLALPDVEDAQQVVFGLPYRRIDQAVDVKPSSVTSATVPILPHFTLNVLAWLHRERVGLTPPRAGHSDPVST
jgi:hypothetical protein